LALTRALLAGIEGMAGIAGSAPIANAADTPCSACGRTDVLYSNRQMKVDVSRRRCLLCMPSNGTPVPTEPTDKEAIEKVPGGDLPKPSLADEPCSACGQVGVLFSKRQIKVDASKRKCLDCMAKIGLGEMVDASAGDPVKPTTATEPCSACGRVGVFYSKRQIKIEPAQRKCLQCMPGGGRQAIVSGTPVPARPVVAQTALAIRRPVTVRPMVRPVGVRPGGAGLPFGGVVATRPAFPWMASPRPAAPRPALAALPAPRPAGALLQGHDPPKLSTAPEPCLGCGRPTALFSKRQLKVPAATRRCVECMGGPGAEEIAAQAAAMAPQTTPEANVPKATMASEPCAGCGRVGALYSKRQIKVDAGKRKCLDCMPAASTASTDKLIPPTLPVVLPASRKRTASEAGLPPTLSVPAQNLSADPCAGCGRVGQAFSNRQMKVEAGKRRCLECMPSQGHAGPSPQDPVAQILTGDFNLTAGTFA